MSLIENLHSAILARIIDNIAGIQTSGFYPKLRTAVVTPAVFVDLVSLEPGDDPGTEQLSVIARFQARAIVTAGENSLIQVRELAAEIARVIHHQNFGQKVTPARLVSVGSDGFSPELDAYDIWLVEWEHEFHLGESVWDGEGVTPDKIFLGYSPEIGIPHEDDYSEIETEIPLGLP